jgi:hypothetical protein
LNKIIEKIANFGAEQRFFVKEDNAERIWLPTPEDYDANAPDPKDYGLRLYTVRVGINTVFLLNGNKKMYKKAQDCTNVGPYFYKANMAAKAIDFAILKDYIEIDSEGYLLTEDNYKLTIS